MFLRYVTFSISNLLKENPRFSWRMKFRNFGLTPTVQQKKDKSKKSRGWFWKKKEDPNSVKIVKPGNCAELPEPILDPQCKVAVIVGGANGFGYAAADHLLCKGAHNVVITDDNPAQGQMAAQKLCDAHGKDRAQFLQCDIRNFCQFEATLKQALLKYKAIHILFNDLDKKRFPSHCNYSDSEPAWNNTTRAIQAGMKIIGKQNGGPGGIIVNCASVFGFMGWPDDPYPVYCMKEPAIESTIDLTKMYDVAETGVRLVALCPTSKVFSEIGLPDFPEIQPNGQGFVKPPCIPSAKWRVGAALNYVLAWAKTGSAWIVEPATSPYENPRLIHFPTEEGGKVDPKVYESQFC